MIGLWWTLARAWWKPALVIAILVGAVLYIRYDATRDERMKQKAKEAEAYEQTMESINEAIDSVRNLTVDDAREWLRKYAE